jgi:hypothetical protein
MMAIRGYKLTHDSGFAPNPFHGVLTLATCMVKIRSARRPGDWVAGFASKGLIERARANGVAIPYMGLIYLGNRVDSEYEIERAGDNIYFRNAAGTYEQVPNRHHDPGYLTHDVSGVNAVICRDFWYLGRKCFVPQGGWSTFLGPRRIDKARLSSLPEDFVQGVLLHFRTRGIKPGINADPCLWKTVTSKAAQSCRPRLAA